MPTVCQMRLQPCLQCVAKCTLPFCTQGRLHLLRELTTCVYTSTCGYTFHTAITIGHLDLLVDSDEVYVAVPGED